MKIVHHFLVVTIFVSIFASLGIAMANANAQWENTQRIEEDMIREVVRDYFDKRYRSRQMNQLEDFRHGSG